jgi:hypothetical protein
MEMEKGNILEKGKAWNRREVMRIGIAADIAEYVWQCEGDMTISPRRKTLALSASGCREIPKFQLPFRPGGICNFS